MVQALADGDTLLAYAMTTEDPPPPMQVGTTTILIFSVSCPSKNQGCTVSEIAIHLPAGKDATDLTNVAPSASAASISPSDHDQHWTSAFDQGTFTFTPDGGPVVFRGQSLTIEVKGIQVSPLVGTADINIIEFSTPAGSPPSPPEKKHAVIEAAKFPADFYCSDFHADKPQINVGDTATLTWIGSDDADYAIAYGEYPSTPVTGRTWTTPQPLYTSTAFILTASTTEGDQTVKMDLNATVIVASPQVLRFSASPDQLDYNKQEVTLDWLAVNADGVWLLAGETPKQPLGGAVPDPNDKKTLQPAYGTTYQLQAYKNPGPTVSPPFPLIVTFNQLVIKKFEADPVVVTSHQPTTLSWDVQHAGKVTYQGQDVAASSSSIETPASDTTYNLTATWAVDGTPVAAAPVHVTVLPVQLDGYPSWTGHFTEPSRSQLLFWSSGQNLGLGTVTGASLGWALAGNAPPGVNPQSVVTWVADFTDVGSSQIVSYSPSDRTWQLGTFTGTGLSWTPIHWQVAENVLIQNGRTWVGDLFDPTPQVLAYSLVNQQFWCGGFVDDSINDIYLLDYPPLSYTGYAPNDPTWVANFTGADRSQILFYSPGDQSWWHGTVWLPIPPTINWIKVGDTASIGYQSNHPTWVADFTGAGKAQILFCCPNEDWWLGSFTGGTTVWSPAPALGWAKAGTTGFGYDQSNHPTWVADFTGAGKSQILFCWPADQNWWLGTFTGPNLGWAKAGNTASQFRYDQSDPTWVADFTGAGKSQLLLYSRRHLNWWLGTFTGSNLSWTQVT